MKQSETQQGGCPKFLSDIIAQCKCNPSRKAVIDGDGRVSSYGDLYDIVKRTSGYIKAKGIRQGAFVTINLPNCMEYLAVEFGSWLAGCGIAPVNPNYPQARIDYIAAHCESPLTVDETILEEIKQAEPLEICEPTAPIAALFYTSGSTGTPKGVMHTFESLGHMDSMREYAGFQPDDCFAFGAPMSFIAWILTLPALRVGACLHLLQRSTITDIHKLQEYYDSGNATCAIINPPSTLKRLNLKGNKSLRFVITGSERVSDVESESGYRLINLYGQTETALTALYFVIDKKYQNTPVGKPTSDFEIKLAEDGEICLRGPLTPGYYKDPERSAALWADGWLHTGDIGRRLPDGNVEYVNRKDWMVKINGQRVETGEIAAVIKEIPAVSDAVAKGFTAPDGQQYIVAYYIADGTIDDAAVRNYISGKLAPYMIPSYFVKMQALPTNFNGKVDIKSLQSPADMAAKTEARDITEPGTDEEKLLCKGFESALGVSPIGIDDDFFAFGGDSIRVMQLQVACPQLDLSSALIYTGKTVRGICAALAESKPKAAVSGDICPLSKTQEGIFAECMQRRGEAVYNNPILLKISGTVDAEKLATACEAAVKAHPNVFATISIGEDGNPLQTKNPAEDCKPAVEQMTDAEFAALRPALTQPFDILADRLFRMRIFKTETAVWLFCDFHHIIFDGTSNSILLEDIEKAYSGDTVAPEPFTGFDVACEEQTLRESPFFEECKKWNLDNFREPDRTSLPDPDKFGDAVAFKQFEINTGISVHAFAKAADRFGVTENVLATGAFGYMLGACSHSAGAAFATIYNGRKSIRTARTMSMMVKTLPVYCKWSGQTSVGDYLGAVKSQLVGAMAHDLHSFAEVCAATSYDSRVIFTWQDELLECKSLCGADCELINLTENATGEPLAVQLYKRGGTLVIRTEYRSNMYSAGYIRKFISCFENILVSLLQADRTAATSSLQLVSAEESRQLIDCGWGYKLEYDKSETVISLFRKHAAARPEATAVVDENGSITYRELDNLSDRLATLLVKSGVEVEDFVALMLPRLRHFPASYLACFKCGAAYVPMDYEYPADRLQYMLENSEAKVLLTTHAIFDIKSAEGEIKAPKVIFVDDVLEDDTAEADANIDRARPEGLAYMIYTSGTTGRPKGVMIEHRSLTNIVKWFIDAEKLGPDARIAEHASFSFDGSVPDLMVPFACGGQLHLLPSAIRKDLAQIYRYLCENRIDGLILTTQLGLSMLKMYDLKLKYLLIGGEKMSGCVNTSVHLYNGYGPTEFTVCSSTYLVDPENVPDNIPIGRAIPNTFSGIVDACGRLLPKGIAGELVVSGIQISRGYWHRDDITAERFVDCPFIPGEKMYRTGDLAKWSDDDQLLYLGRIDTQVKLRGFRIELGEIESDLLKYEGIKSAVVAVKEISGLQHLCAYYCSDTQIDTAKLRDFLASMLTDYMVPTAYIQMDALPMTPGGKVDMRSLPVPEIKAEEIVAPASDLEAELLKISTDYLKNDSFGVTTDLISMGMTSLGAISLSVLIEKQMGISIPSPKMLEHPTVREWAAMAAGSEGATKEEVSEYQKRTYYPMTDNQTGIYLDWEKSRDGIQYNIPMVLRLEGISPETAAGAVKAFVAAHPYVKTRFKSVDGAMVQLRCDAAPVEVPVTELQADPDEAFWKAQLRPFNLLEGQLCRFEVFHRGGVVWLLSDFHHTIFDGGSEAVYAKAIADFCNGRQPDREALCAFDYSLYYGEWKESEAFAKAGQYFASLLDGATAASLPSSGDTGITGLAAVDLTLERAGIRECCRSNGVTENALFLSAVTEVLHRFMREDNLAILTVSNGRSLRSLEHTCGLFVQTLPVVSHHTRKTVSEALKAMHSQITGTLERDKYPYTKIVEDTGVRPEILVAYQGDVLGGQLTAGGKAMEMFGIAGDTAKTPLAITITPAGTSVELHFEYDAALYTDADIRRYALAVKAFAENLAAAASDTDIADIACVSAEDTASLIKTGSGEKLEVETDATIVTLMRRHTAEHPDDTAIVDCAGSISWAEYDKASDALAAVLIQSGVGKEDFVGLMMPRRKEFAIAFMATFKAGGAYVPMDYEYPFERLQYMLEDSGAKVLLTTREIYEQKKAEGELKAGKVIFVDELDLTGAAAAPVDNSTPGGLAYMIYTSGTTGKPKGVMIEHHSLMNLMAWQSKLEHIVRGTRVAEHASFSFDASVYDTMTTVGYGGTLYILDEHTRKDPALMDKYLRDNAIEVICMSTQLGMMMLSSYDLGLRVITMGGEKLTGKYGKTPMVINGYGPTEFTVSSSVHVVEPGRDYDNIPIGRAVPNTVSAIVDTCGQLVPHGAPGELVLIGPQMARGYWNREDITRKRFAPCHFIPGERMYHTGDLARWSDSGELLYMGRIDTQVKLRGFRIEMGEIESTISSFDGIKSSVAKVCNIGGTEHLCAYYTASKDIDEAALHAHLASRLTSYMVPDALMRLDSMPLTPNGKIDTKKLPVPEISTGRKVSAFEAPEGEIERNIADTFAKALGATSPISRNDSFFDIGGTSLLVMKVIVALGDLGYKLTYGDVFKYQTPRAIAAFVEGFEAGSESSEASAVVLAAASEMAGMPATGDDGFDYRGINKVLASNRPEAVSDIAELDANKLGDVLLLGSTGFLGIHILQRLLTEYDGKIYCVIRPRKGVTCAGRLKSYLMYYFDRTWAELFDKRLFVVEGDMTDDAVMTKLLEIKVDTVINCAANVKHFAAGDEISKINLDGTLKLVDFCLKTGSRLIHTSTHSISGQMEGQAAVPLAESTLYIGQKLMTKYQTSKFQAERAILDACSTKGLKAKIMRLGNLMPRFSDGEFQINVENNGFMARMRAYYLIGCIASSHLHAPLEFAPIDETASAILTLARTPDKFTVFHPYNNHTIYTDDVVAIMRGCGLEIKTVNDGEFSARLGACLEDDHLNPFITTLMAYSSHSNFVVNPPSQDFTMCVLNAMNWRWPITGTRYLSDAIEKIKSLEYFDK